MKKTYIIFKAIVAAFVIALFAGSINVEAAPKTMADGNVFDAEFYASAYPDVRAVFGNNEVLLYQHYVMFGAGEGRLPYDAAALSQANAALVPVGPNGVTEEQAYAIIMSLQPVFPEGQLWDTSLGYYEYRGFSNVRYLGGDCAYFAFLINDYVFGFTPNARIIDTFDPAKFRTGDILRVVNNSAAGGHSMIVLTKDANGITVAESNYNGRNHWGRRLSWTELAASYDYIMTRYNF